MGLADHLIAPTESTSLTPSQNMNPDMQEVDIVGMNIAQFHVVEADGRYGAICEAHVDPTALYRLALAEAAGREADILELGAAQHLRLRTVSASSARL